MGKSFSQEIETWTAAERISLAKERVRSLTDRVLYVIDLHVSNEIILYSDKLSNQIPKSYAARTFSVLQDSQFKFEVISLLVLWDRAQSNAVSIPTVIELIDDDNVISQLADECYKLHSDRGIAFLNKNGDPDIQKMIESSSISGQKEFAQSRFYQARAILAACIKTAKEAVQRERMDAVRNLRDRASHSLDFTHREKNKTIAPMKYGDEKELLNQSILLIQDLYCWVNGTSFNIEEDCFEAARKSAEELWHNCKFEISGSGRK